MYSFPRVNGEENMVGWTTVYFINTRLVTSIPRARNQVILGDIISAPFYAGYSIFGDLIFKDDPQRTKAGVIYPVEIMGSSPVDKPEYLNLYTEMVEDEFIAAVLDLNGRFKLCGTLEKGLKFIYKTEKTGYTWKFYGEYKNPPPFYFGNLAVDNTIYQPNHVPGVTYTVGGYWILGTGLPGAGTGKEGDVYIDTVTNIYYQRTAGVWVQVGYLGPDQELEEYAFCMTSLALTGNLI